MVVVDEVEVLEPIKHNLSLVSKVLVTRVQNIQIFPKESGKGAKCIIDGVVELSSVVSQQRVPGRIYSHKNKINETGASPTN